MEAGETDPSALEELTKQRGRLERTVGRLHQEIKLGKDRNRQALLNRGEQAAAVLADKSALSRENRSLQVHS